MVAATQAQPQPTLDEFLSWPETKPDSEYFDGKIEQKPLPQGQHSTLQIRLGTYINEYALSKKIAHAFTDVLEGS